MGIPIIVTAGQLRHDPFQILQAAWNRACNVIHVKRGGRATSKVKAIIHAFFIIDENFM
jgi:hypothetical protein